MMKKGLLIVVSAPAGCGKDTILECAFNVCPHLHYSVSATTRTIREGEQEGVHYFFKSIEEFKKMIKTGELLEYTQYAGNYYGTPKAYIPSMLESGKDVVMKIEVDGASNIKKLFPSCVLVFILPPSFEELERRLQKRGTEDAKTIKTRVDIARIEMSFVKNYDYVIINEKLEEAVKDFAAIVKSEKLSVKRGFPTVK
ncbi:MAG: guanylate kinase [Oscillospiraceae bacterium]|nr:guanylate kinase [Oscillospiraceae bacterium]